MTVGMLFLLIALIFFFLAAIEVGLPWQKSVACGLFALTLGTMLSGIPIPWGR